LIECFELITFKQVKLFAFILSINILFLTVAPSLPVIFSQGTPHCQMSCCAHEGKKNLPKECNGMGNPFMSCCNIFALTAQPQGLATPSTHSNQNFSSPIEKLCADFLSDAWHPPKIV